MSREEFQNLKGGVVKRRRKRCFGLFIDGTGLDRATRRLERKVDLSRLVNGITEGLKPEVARYYTLIPYEDDARQFAFLDAVERAGLEVIVKRLPPKGVKRQVSMDVHMATDIIAYSFGKFGKQAQALKDEAGEEEKQVVNGPPVSVSRPCICGAGQNVQRLAAVVCPTREVSYALYMSHTLGTETHLADFGLYGTSEGWRGIDRWVDLSNSETIWRP